MKLPKKYQGVTDFDGRRIDSPFQEAVNWASVFKQRGPQGDTECCLIVLADEAPRLAEAVVELRALLQKLDETLHNEGYTISHPDVRAIKDALEDTKEWEA